MELRWLRRARRGEPIALEHFWGQIAEPAWSVAAALLPRDQALDVMAELKSGLLHDLRGLARGERWRRVAFRRLWRALWRSLELPPLSSIDPDRRWPALTEPAPAVPSADPGDARKRMRAAVKSAPPELQLIYLYDLFADIEAAEVAAFAGVDEMLIRRGRSSMALHLVRALRGTP